MRIVSRQTDDLKSIGEDESEGLESGFGQLRQVKVKGLHLPVVLPNFLVLILQFLVIDTPHA